MKPVFGRRPIKGNSIEEINNCTVYMSENEFNRVLKKFIFYAYDEKLKQLIFSPKFSDDYFIFIDISGTLEIEIKEE